MKHDPIDQPQRSQSQPVTRDSLDQSPASGTPAKARRSWRKRVLPGLIALAALTGGAYEGHAWWTTGRFMVSTDDAYVQADITLISSRVQGYVKVLSVSDNDHVKAGDILVKLDDGDFRIALNLAKRKVETASQTLKRIKAQIEAARASVAQAEANRDAAKAQLRNARISFSRISDLVARKVTSQAQMDSATEDQDTAQAKLASAKAAADSAKAEIAVLEGQYGEARSQRQELELDVAQAQRNLDMTVLRAPTSGTIANIAIEKGDLVTAGKRLAALVPDRSYYIEANFKETQMEGVAPGAKVHLTFDALPGRSFDGTVASVAPATGAIFSLLPAENATGNFTKIVQRVPVRINIPQKALETRAIRAGLSVVVDVDSRTAGDHPVSVAHAD